MRSMLGSLLTDWEMDHCPIGLSTALVNPFLARQLIGLSMAQEDLTVSIAQTLRRHGDMLELPLQLPCLWRGMT